LFSQISLGTLGSENLGTPRKRRGDLNPSNTLEQFLASENNSIKLDDPANVDRIIWGTTVNIEDSIRMFRDFVLNYSENDTPFYNEVLKNVPWFYIDEGSPNV
jgi:DNA replication licensing factor MCM4